MAKPLMERILEKLKNHENRLDNLETKDDWQTATLQNCTSNSSGLGGKPGVRYKKVGNTVRVEGSITATYEGSSKIFTNLPVRV